jgi:hypothetical protein
VWWFALGDPKIMSLLLLQSKVKTMIHSVECFYIYVWKRIHQSYNKSEKSSFFGWVWKISITWLTRKESSLQCSNLKLKVATHFEVSRKSFCYDGLVCPLSTKLSQAPLWGQFHQRFMHTFFVRKSFEQLFSAWSLALNKLLYEKCTLKMLMKLAPENRSAVLRGSRVRWSGQPL